MRVAGAEKRSSGNRWCYVRVCGARINRSKRRVNHRKEAQDTSDEVGNQDEVRAYTEWCSRWVMIDAVLTSLVLYESNKNER